jgi:hypothetical protein
MKRYIWIGMIVLFTLPLFGNTEIAGVNVKEKLSFDGVDYRLNGAGIRKKLVLKLYVGSLYTEKKVKAESEILKGPAAAVIRLDIISGLITSELMAETIEEGFDKAMSGNTAPLRNEIDDFIAVFDEEIEKGDQFTFISMPGTGVKAYKGEKLLTEIKDDRFREVLFAIWLGDDPADKKLKKAMLD